MKTTQPQLFPNDHVCPLAIEQNSSRCSNASGKPDSSCAACRIELVNKFGPAMFEGNISFFEMLFVGHPLQTEGFKLIPHEDGGIKLRRATHASSENPGDCLIEALHPTVGGGYSLFIVVDDNHEIVESFDSIDEVMKSYFSRKAFIDKLVEEKAKPNSKKRRLSC